MAADEVLRFMIRWFARHDTPPTVRQVWKAATEAAEARFTSTNSAMDAIAALADKWCGSTNQPDNICIALYQFTQWARQQRQ